MEDHGNRNRTLRRVFVIGLAIAAIGLIGMNLISTHPDPPARASGPDLWSDAQRAPKPASLDDALSFSSEPEAADGADLFDADRASADGEPALSGPYDCLIEPRRVVELASALSAVVDRVHVERSDVVEAGQVVVELESDVERAAVEVAAARAKMAGSVRAREATLELGVSRRQRATDLHQSRVVSADAVEQAETEAELAQAELEQATDQMRLWELQLDEAEERLDRRILRSPISGVVIERHKSAGEIAKEETLLTIAEIDPLRVRVIVPAAAFGHIDDGMRAEVHPELPDVGVQVASVDIIDRVIDPTSGTFGVWLELPNADRSIPSGLRCHVRFLDEQEVAARGPAARR